MSVDSQLVGNKQDNAAKEKLKKVYVSKFEETSRLNG